MKKLIYTFLLLSNLLSNVFAQKIPASSFPIGGFNISSLFPPASSTPPYFSFIIDSMRKIGFNSYYEADYQNELSTAARFPANMQMYMGMAYYPGELLTKHYVGDRFEDGLSGIEKRYFLASPLNIYKLGYKFDYERSDFRFAISNRSSNTLQTNWKVLQGDSTYTSSSSGEWKILSSDADGDGNMLKLEIAKGTGGDWGHSELDYFQNANNDEVYADFIFRFDGTPTADDIYEIKVTGEAGSISDNFTFKISGSDYSGHKIYMNDYTNNNGLNNPKTLFFFPDPSSSTNPKYAVVRINNFGNVSDDTSGIMRCLFSNTKKIKDLSKLTFELKPGAHSSGNNIYVRGFRLRNRITDYLLSNRLTHALPGPPDNDQTYSRPEIVNTDQGSQFTSEEFTALLKDQGVRISMDSKGRAIDNIFIERFWRTLKYEHIYLQPADDGVRLYEGVCNYIDFYNRERLHQFLGYKTPLTCYRKAA